MKKQIVSESNPSDPSTPNLSASDFDASYDFAAILGSLMGDDIATVPTETVEGFAICLNSSPALAKLIKLKDRDYHSGKIFTLVPESPAAIGKYALIPAAAKPLIKQYIPGSLTLILPKNPRFSHPYYDHFNTIGIRIPKHELFDKLLPETGALILTSANKRGGTPKILGGKPSTIIDFSGKTPKLLRQGDLKISL